VAYVPWWVVALLTADVTLIALDVLQRNGLLEDLRFLVTHERGFGESFQYGKGTALAVGLLVVARSRRSVAALVVAAIFLWIVLDDALMLHERAGVRLAEFVQIPSWLPLRPQDAGELIVFGAVGLAVAAALAAVWRYGPIRGRITLAAGALGFLALGFFGVGLDLVHALVPRGHWLRATLAVTEDGGEMLVLTAVLAVMFLVHRGG
jgi:hypothetical protein